MHGIIILITMPGKLCSMALLLSTVSHLPQLHRPLPVSPQPINGTMFWLKPTFGGPQTQVGTAPHVRLIKSQLYT